MTLREKQAAMRRKHLKKRPWDDRKEDSCHASQLRLRKLFAAGWSDLRIAELLGVNRQVIWFLRAANCRRRES